MALTASESGAVSRTQREARSAARLSHPHVVSVLDQGHAYQAWLQNEEGNMVPAGLMRETDGEMVLDGDVNQAKGVGVTVEPAGGSDQPTSDPIALVELS